jgi:hypothetical protein
MNFANSQSKRDTFAQFKVKKMKNGLINVMRELVSLVFVGCL